MHSEIESLPDDIGKTIVNRSGDIYHTHLDKQCKYLSDEAQLMFCATTAKFISKLYRTVINPFMPVAAKRALTIWLISL